MSVTTLTTGPMSLSIPWNYSAASYPTATPNISSQGYSGPTLTNGTGAGNVNVLYAAQLTIAASGTTTIDLATLTDYFGNSIAFVRIKSLYIENSSLGKASAIAVGNAGSNPFAGIISPGTATISIRNGACFFVGMAADATAYAVGTGVNLLITNSDSVNAATVNVVISGCNA